MDDPARLDGNQEFDKYADRYEELLADPLRDCFAKRAEYFHRRKLEVLLSHLRSLGKSPADLRWLDLGCGKGDLLRLGRPEFAEAYGCDVSAESVKYCQDPRVRVQATAEGIPFPAQTFDVVTAACVYHHVQPSQRAVLTRSVREVLRPNGLVCIFEHNPWNPVTQAIVRRSPIDVNAILLRPRETAALLGESGLDVVSLQYYLFFPQFFGSSFIEPVEGLLRRLPLGGQYAIFAGKRA